MRRIVSALLLLTMLSALLPALPVAAELAPHVQPDNSGGNDTLEARVNDESDWPYVKVTVKNSSPWWIHVNRQWPDNSVSISTNDSLWAAVGYIPPGGEAKYTLLYNTNVGVARI